MATSNFQFVANGVQFNLMLTFAGAATSGQVTAVSGTVGGAPVTGISTYGGANNFVSATAPYLTFDGLGFAIAGNLFNVYHDSGTTFVIDSDSTYNDAVASNIVFDEPDPNTPPVEDHNLGSTVAEGGTDTVTAAELDFNDAEQADAAITYTVTSAATNGTLFLNGVALALNDTFTQDDINNNRVTYTHDDGETTSAAFGFTVSDGAGGSVTGQNFAFTVTPVNDPPTGPGLPASQSFTEDQVGAELDLSALNLGDVDSPALTLTLSVTDGTFDLAASPNVTIAGNLTSTVTITGSAADINNYLNQPSNTWFVPPLDFAGAATLTATLNDNDGSGEVALGTMSLNVTAVNDDPTAAGVPTDIAVTEDLASNVDLSAITFADVDSGAAAVTFTIAASAGVLAASSGGSVAVAGSGTAMLTLTGTAANIDAYLNTVSNIRYRGGSNGNGNDAATLTLSANDGGATGAGGGGNVALGTINIDITPVNDAPVITVQGTLDALVANFGSDNVNVLLGDGLGGFTAAATVGVGTTPQSVALGDVDGDGDLDALVANGNSGNVSVLLGDGLGGFTAAAAVGAGNQPRSVALGDVDGDGDLDALVGNLFNNNVSVLLGDGAGGFSAAAAVGVGSGPRSVALGDVDGDGDLDALVANFGSNDVSVLLGNGAGGFSAAAAVGAGAGPFSVALGDVDGDGDLDALVANSDSANVSVLIGDGAGGFTAAAPVGVGNSPISVALGDVDGDGDLDALVANFGSNNVSVLLGNGLGGFTAAPVGAGFGPFSVSLGDVDGDGDLDALVANLFGNNVRVLLGNGLGGFTAAATVGVGDGPASVALGNLDNAQVTDEDTALLFNAANGNAITLSDADHNGGDETLTFTVAFGTLFLATTADLTIVSGDGSGAVTLTGSVAEINAALDGLSYAPIANYNGGDTLEITVDDNGNSGSGGARTATKLAPIVIAAVNDAPSGTDNTIAIDEDHDFGAGYALTAADFGFTDPDGDTFSGVLITTLPAAGGLFLWTGTGYAEVLAGDTIPFADIDAGDLVFFSDPDESGLNYASFTFQVIDDGGIANNGEDTDQTPNTITFDVAAVNDAPRIRLQPALDIVGVLADADPGESLVEIVSGDGNGEASPFGGDFAFVSDGATRLAVADFDGDGALDVATASFTTGEVTVLIGDNCGCTDEAPGSPIGGFILPTAIEAADINGDNNIDLLVSQRGVGVPGFGSVVTLLGAGDGTFTLDDAYQTGTVTVDLALGDFDGVNGVDFVTISQTGSISVGLNDGAGAFSEDPVIPLAGAASPSAVAVGDINGDGDLDIAVADSSGGVVLLFGDGLGGFTEQPTVAVGDAPSDIALGDLDGDTDLDIVTANANGTTVSVLLNNGAGTFAPRVDYAAGAGPNAVALGDMDDDGDLDIVAASGINAQYHVLLGDGNGAFTPDATPIDSIGTAWGGTISAIALGQIDPEAEETLPIVVSYTEGQTLTLVPRLVATDIDGGGTAVGATVFLAGPPDGPGGFPGDVLAATGTANITVAYDPVTFTLTLSTVTPQPLADFQQVLRTVTFASGDDPDLGGALPMRVIGITIDDGGLDGEGLSAPIGLQITAVNDAPTDITGVLTVNEYAANGTVVGAVVAQDVDSTIFTYTLLNSAGGRFAMDSAGNVTVADGLLLDREQAASHTITVQADDGAGGIFSRQLTVSIGDVDPENIVDDNRGNIFIGGPGNDRIDGRGGIDQMTGGGGNDLYYVDDAGDQVIEAVGGGALDMVSTSVNYALGAGQQIEIFAARSQLSTTAIALTGNGFANRIGGNNGVNRIDGGAGADNMFGYAANDLYFVDNVGDLVNEAIGGGDFDMIQASIDFTLPAGQEIEVLTPYSIHSSHATNMTGNEFNNRIGGNLGVNRIDGGAGADNMFGYAGNDFYTVDNTGDRVNEAIGGGDLDMVVTKIDFTLTVGQEIEIFTPVSVTSTNAINLTGNEFANRIGGNLGVNRIDGGAGADNMFGYAGNDFYTVDNTGDRVNEAIGGDLDMVVTKIDFTLTAGQEIEIFTPVSVTSTNAIKLTGNEFANRIGGNAGVNRIDGGAGADVLFGYGGNDVFVFRKGQANGDVVHDFNGNLAGVGDSFEFVGYGSDATFTALDATHWRITYNAGASHEVITIANGASIHTSDVFI